MQEITLGIPHVVLVNSRYQADLHTYSFSNFSVRVDYPHNFIGNEFVNKD